MTAFLPPNLLALFAPRDPIPYLVPMEKLPHDKKRAPYSGLSEYLHLFEDPKDTPAPVKAETRQQRKERKQRERAELQAYKIEQGIAMWDPASNEASTTDPYKTLFVGRIDFETSESKLRREFERYGSIKRIVMVRDKDTNKFRGYAFIEYEHERDMHAAYKKADGTKINNRRVLVDVERGRTVKGWLPRRLGGGLGNTRRPKGPGGTALDEDGNETQFREESQSRGERGGSSGGSGVRRSRERSSRRSRSPRERPPPERRERGGRRSRSRSPRRGGRADHRDGGGGGRERERREPREDRRRSRDRESRRGGSRDKERESRRDRDRDRNGAPGAEEQS